MLGLLKTRYNHDPRQPKLSLATHIHFRLGRNPLGSGE